MHGWAYALLVPNWLAPWILPVILVLAVVVGVLVGSIGASPSTVIWVFLAVVAGAAIYLRLRDLKKKPPAELTHRPFWRF